MKRGEIYLADLTPRSGSEQQIPHAPLMLKASNESCAPD
jgi:mRNA-degrading endonuclease toxin of MazEF toxin-antitoxin module